MFSAQRIYPVDQSLKLCCLMGLLVVLLLSPVDARHTRRPRRTTTPRTPRPTTQVPELVPDRHHHLHHWPPLVAPPHTPSVAPIPQHPATAEPMPQLVDSFDQRSVDGQYEFRYQLDNGNTRYERAYWLPVGEKLVLARKGYYSFPLPNRQFSTVFYRADHLGYHVDMNTLSGKQPLLPRNLEVPQAGARTEAGAAKRNSISMPERNDQEQEPQDQGQEVELLATGVRVDSGKDEEEGPTELAPNALNQVETETEPSTVANDILATEAAVDNHDDDADADDDQKPDGGDSN
ncbi:uncharacterized protein [Drosophila pseudoobscura]|uniref:Uncharacterized protein n=1 Tax=Drosophila pseudoobscura pseudoobscura TaxID=46245 RepID=A0A6I8UFR9_DROPS|nr:uncharacterized protein LOC4814895 [Drosophila pseudoobscura]